MSVLGFLKFTGLAVCCLFASVCVGSEAIKTDPVSVGTGDGSQCNGARGVEVTVPLIKTLDEFRESVVWQNSKSIDVNGKIIIYKKYLMVNEPNKGIHIFNNEDPTNPLALGFLSILGNTDFMVRNDTIYADSIIDLVLIDISNLADIHEIGRSLNIYKRDINRFGPFWINGRPVVYDTSKEIVVGQEKVCINY